MRHHKYGEQLHLFFDHISEDITSHDDTWEPDDLASIDEPAAASKDKGLDVFAEEIQGRMSKAEAAEQIEEIQRKVKDKKNPKVDK